MWRDHLGSAAVMLPVAAYQSRLRRYADLAGDADVLPSAWQVETTRIIAQLRRAGAIVSWVTAQTAHAEWWNNGHAAAAKAVLLCTICQVTRVSTNNVNCLKLVGDCTPGFSRSQ